VAIAVTGSAMGIASATGLAKTPSAASLEEDSGGNAASDSTDTVPTGPSSGTVDVTLAEWSITTSVKSAKAVAVTFNIENTGAASIASLTSPVSAGQNAIIKVQTSPGASCSIVYTHPSGKTSTATGLDPKTADANGTVTWTWLISQQTQPLGNGKVLVTCGGKSAEATIVIQ